MIEPTSPLFDGITARQVDTARISARVLLRDGDRSDTPAERTVVLLHGLLSSSLIWQEFMEELPSDLRVVTRLDGTVVQDGTTRDLIFPIADLIAYASRAFTLLPGDVILTGTPAGVGPVQPGQRVEVEVEGIGTLSNPFVRR